MITIVIATLLWSISLSATSAETDSETINRQQFPFHELALVGLGMPLLDSLDLDALASEALKHERWEFLFIGAPLRVQGGTGAPLNPLAVF